MTQHRMRPAAPVLLLIVLAACTTTTTSPTTAPVATATADATEEPSATATAAASSSTAETAELAVSWTVPFTMTAPADWGQDQEPLGSSRVIDSGVDRWIVFSDSGPDTVEGWIEQLTTTAQLVVTEPEPAEIGGAEGLTVDVSTSSDAPMVSGGAPCANPCWALIQDAQASWIAEEGRPNRVWVVDVDGETIAIVTDAPEGAFESWTATVEDVLGTLEWGQ